MSGMMAGGMSNHRGLAGSFGWANGQIPLNLTQSGSSEGRRRLGVESNRTVDSASTGIQKFLDAAGYDSTEDYWASAVICTTALAIIVVAGHLAFLKILR